MDHLFNALSTMDGYIHAYTLSLVIKKTFESILIDFRHVGGYRERTRDMEFEMALREVNLGCNEYVYGNEDES